MKQHWLEFTDSEGKTIKLYDDGYRIHWAKDGMTGIFAEYKHSCLDGRLAESIIAALFHDSSCSTVTQIYSSIPAPPIGNPTTLGE